MRADGLSDGHEAPACSRGSLSALAPEVADDFARFAEQVRRRVEQVLGPWLDRQVAAARADGEAAAVAAEAVRTLVMRGGKRMRPLLACAAYEACAGPGGWASACTAGMALELLQGYFLAHDDWMDDDATRRGGPSTPAMMRARFDEHTAMAMSVLAGDLAAAWARQAVLESPQPPVRVLAAAREVAAIEAEVVRGQAIDVCGCARSRRELEAMYALKTASYSVRGPLVVGARLAGATEAQVSALARFGDPLGVAFQLRDDLLGAFGDPAATGKPVGTDLRRGKRTAVVADPDAERAAGAVLGRPDAGDEEVRAALGRLEACGARASVERRIGQLTESALRALDEAPLADRGRRLLRRAARALVERQA